jgi:hypothetical protein
MTNAQTHRATSAKYIEFKTEFEAFVNELLAA